MIKYILNIFPRRIGKLLHEPIYKSMFLIKNGTNAISILYTDSHKSFPILWRKLLKCILSYLYCTKYNEINVCHLHIHKNVFHNI